MLGLLLLHHWHSKRSISSWSNTKVIETAGRYTLNAPVRLLHLQIAPPMLVLQTFNSCHSAPHRWPAYARKQQYAVHSSR